MRGGERRWERGVKLVCWGRERELEIICFIELLCDTVDGLATRQSPSLYTFSFHMLF